MLIGLTGLIGSGKSEVARIFAKHGAFVVSADKIGRDVVEKNKSILRKLVQIFGRDIISKSGQLDRKKLGRLAFSSEKNKEKLNKIVHPALLRELSAQVKKAGQEYDFVIIDAALLIYWGWDKKVDKTILVDTILRKRIQRLKAKGYTEAEVKARTKFQPKLSDLSRHADYILKNNSTRKILKKKVENIIVSLTERG
ncbi:MAG: dephospho-CoA kinase [Candidatus Zixiibacteriota bacterium]|nr:MAG: dephospho-CoA kinase [candidate division Zixibacteria bacterium]